MHQNSDPLQKTSNRIALFGTFDVDNYGDCLFPLIVKYHLTKRLKQVELYLFSPTNRTAKVANYPRVYGFNELHKIFREPPSAIIVGGGALLRTGHGLSIYPQIRHILYPYTFKCWLLPIMIADLIWNCSSFLNAVGDAPPYDEQFIDLIAKYMNKVTLCLVRDKYTQERLSQIGVKAEVVPDCGFSLSHLLPESKWSRNYYRVSTEFHLPKKYLVAHASFHLGSNYAVFAKAVADAANKTNLPVVLLPISHHLSDIQSLKVVRRILNKQGVKTYLINKLLDTIQTSSVLANTELYIGVSLHGAIASLSFGKPAVSFSVSKTGKHYGALLAVGLEICHTDQLDMIPEKASQLLKMPRVYFTEKVEAANRRIDDYFDSMARIIESSPRASIPKGWRQKTSTGEIIYEDSKDFQILKQLCLVQKKQISIWRNYIQYIVRQNLVISQYYDLSNFRLGRVKQAKY
jgi:polysaccharide pyruvyl transferase WcaK-like protein